MGFLIGSNWVILMQSLVSYITRSFGADNNFWQKLSSYLTRRQLWASLLLVLSFFPLYPPHLSLHNSLLPLLFLLWICRRVLILLFLGWCNILNDLWASYTLIALETTSKYSSGLTPSQFITYLLLFSINVSHHDFRINKLRSSTIPFVAYPFFSSTSWYQLP